MRRASDSSFFEKISGELAKRKPRHTLAIDKDLTFHIPVGILSRYETDAGVEGFWNAEYGSFIFVFVRKLDADARVDEISKDDETWPLDGSQLIADYGDEIDFGGKLPARFGFIIESPTALGGYRGRGNEAIIVPIQWRQD